LIKPDLIQLNLILPEVSGLSGLGLAIRNATTRRYNGKIWADNSSKGDAIISFLLPIRNLKGRQDKPTF